MKLQTIKKKHSGRSKGQVVVRHQGGAHKRFLRTIEFYPEEGKYHFSGHRACNTRFSPQEIKAKGKICPVCGKPMTIGVLNRVEDLAGRIENRGSREDY